jgi:hypothetical protein
MIDPSRATVKSARSSPLTDRGRRIKTMASALLAELVKM